MNAGTPFLTWFCRNYVFMCLPQQFSAPPPPPRPLRGSFFKAYLIVNSLLRVAIKLWKPCSEAKNSHPKGGERGGGGTPLVALAGLHAGTAVCSYVLEMKEERVHFDQLLSAGIAVFFNTLPAQLWGVSDSPRVDPDCSSLFHGVRRKPLSKYRHASVSYL